MLTVPPPGPNRTEANLQERTAWAHLAHGCEAALRELDPRHPERETFTELLRGFRLAAQVHGATLREVK